MNTKALAKNYSLLTPEERFRLILAALGRGDEAERDRLVRSAGRITLCLQDHAPYLYAFDELALLVFIELLEEAARYLQLWDAWAYAHDADDRSGGQDREAEEDGSEADGDEADEEADESADAESEEDDDGPALAAGYVLRAKADGWKLFCERLNVPAFELWKGLPGFDRLQRALALAETLAFVAEGFLRWLNAVRRRRGKPQLTELPLTAAAVAAATEEIFRQRVQWWGG